MRQLVLYALLPLLVGPLTFVAIQAIKRVSASIDALPKPAKQTMVVAVSFFLTLLGSWANIDLHCDASGAVNCLDTLDTNAVQGVVAAIVAFLLHTLKTRGAAPR